MKRAAVRRDSAASRPRFSRKCGNFPFFARQLAVRGRAKVARKERVYRSDCFEWHLPPSNDALESDNRVEEHEQLTL